MRLLSTITYLRCFLFIVTGCLFFDAALFGQQTTMRDYVLFNGNGTCPGGHDQRLPARPGYAVQLGASSYIEGGSVGSYHLVKSIGKASINANIYSGGSIHLAND